MDRTPINRRNFNQVISLFDRAYKQGVYEAAKINNEYYCSNFILEKSKPSTFGLLQHDYEMDWREWRFILSKWCDTSHLRALYNNVIMTINTPTYLMVILQFAQDYYVQGVKDWLEYPNRMGLKVFLNKQRCRWKPYEGKLYSVIQTRSYITDIQERAYYRQHNCVRDGDMIKSKSYTVFATNMWRCSVPLPKVY